MSRATLPILLALAAFTFGACGGDDPTPDSPAADAATETQATTETTPPPTETAEEESPAGGGAEARADEIIECLDGEGFEALKNSGDSDVGEEFNIVVGGSISIIHVYADEAAASEAEAVVKREAVPPSEVKAIGDVVVEVRTSSALDEAAIDKSRAASTTCASG